MLTIAGYTLTDIIYEGSNTLVYRGVRDSDNAKVIIKMLKNEFPSPNLLAQFNREHQLLSSLQGVGTAKILSLETQKNTIAIVMLDEDYHPIKQLMGKPIPLSDFFNLAINIIEILEVIHSHHIIHKDLNPYNILINDNTQKINIIDFGISSLLLKEDLELEPLQKLEGMLDYISPEQTGRMNRSIDHRSDFYSLGVNFYEMLTGKLPFQETDILELVHSHLAVIPPSVNELNPSVPHSVSAIVAKLLSKIPEDRYASAAGIKADLLECQKQWETHKTIHDFVLGQKDIHDNLIASQKLYGRDIEVQELLETFKKTSEGENKLLFITGYSGIGKTSLVKEIYKPITRQNGYIVSGKFDQLQRSTPYSAFFEAFEELIRFWLTEPEDKLLIFKKELLAALGGNGQVIVDVIPSLELILGPQPSVQALNPTASQDRFLLTVKNFARALAQKNHPLVIFLDDLQWVDSGSLQLIELLLSDADLHYFFLIGAYRDNEVGLDHPLEFFKKTLEKNNVTYKTIKLAPLTSKDVHQVIADSLNMPRKKIRPLADIVLNKTQGNPFYLFEFLRKLHQNHLLYYSYHEYCWRWDAEKIKSEVITDNVVDLLIGRIYTLPENTQRLLEFAGCIGHVFNLETLHIISECPLRDLAKPLFLATQSVFITPLNKNYQLLELPTDQSLLPVAKTIEYRFIHDRVQQAAYQLIPDNIKREVHLKIGRLLLGNQKVIESDEQLFNILSHFDRSLDLIQDREEKIKISELNLRAGQKARLSAAYQAGKSYLLNGLKLIEQVDVEKNSDLYFELVKELATCQFLTGEFKEADLNYNSLASKAKGNLSLFEIYKLQLQALIIQNKHTETLKLGLKALKLLNIHIPLKPTKLRLLWSMFKVYRLISKIDLDTAELPLMTEERFQLAAELLGQITLSTISKDEILSALLACTNIELSLKHGYFKTTVPQGFLYTGIIITTFKAKNLAFKFIDFLMRQEKKYNLVSAKARHLLLQALLFNLWRYPFEECYDNILKVHQVAVEEGDHYVAIISILYASFYAIMSGKTFPEILNLSKIARQFIEKSKMQQFSDMTNLYSTIFEKLGENAEINTKFLKQLEDSLRLNLNINTVGISTILGLAMQFAYLNGFTLKAKQMGEKIFSLKNYLKGTVAWFHNQFYYGLAILADKEISYSAKKILKRIHKYLKRCVKWYPTNFTFYLLLFEAELARSQNQATKAIQLYKKCVQDAENSNILSNIGLVNECAGNYYLSLNLKDIARIHFLNAHHAFQHLGAKALCKRLENKFPEWFRLTTSQRTGTTVTIDTSVASLDVLSLLRATQVISREIQLEPLLKQLIVVLLQNAGAQRGALIMRQDDIWYIAVEGTTEAQHITLIGDKDKSIENRQDIPLSLIRYVQRTQELILAQSEQDFEAFADDPYIKQIKPQSVIVLPINYQGQMTTILFLENRTTSHAFTPEHVHILKVLSSQAVISLENAKLYYQATHDPLTGLANRNLLYQIFESAKARAKRKTSCLAILFLDLDGFKKINDTLGHEIGDKLLIYFAERLKSSIRESDLAARLGGDEFIAMLEDTDKIQITQISERLLDKNESIVIQGHTIQIGTSIGVSLYPEHGQTIQELLKQADLALYRAKALGKGNFQFYTNNLDQQLKAKNKLESELSTAAERGEFFLLYQPIYSANDHVITHFEALLRWQHPTLGLLEPEQFLYLAESTGLIINVGEWVFNTVFKQLQHWKEKGLDLIPVAINISGIQLKRTTLSETLVQLFKTYDIPPHLLELEFTENIFIDIDEKFSFDLVQLKKLGIKLTLDDFGSMYSSLNYLHRFHLDKIKIDQSFIKDLTHNAKSRELVLSIIDIAHNLQLQVIAEGVETEEQMLILESHKIDGLQGFYFSKPMIAANASKLLMNKLLNNVT